MIGRLHSDICNVVPYLLPGVKLQIKITKGKRPFYLMSTTAEYTTKFQFLEACLIVKSTAESLLSNSVQHHSG